MVSGFFLLPFTDATSGLRKEPVEVKAEITVYTTRHLSCCSGTSGYNCNLTDLDSAVTILWGSYCTSGIDL